MCGRYSETTFAIFIDAKKAVMFVRYAMRHVLLLSMLCAPMTGCSDVVSVQDGTPWGLGEQAPDDAALAAREPVLKQELLGGYRWRQQQITAALCNDTTFDYTFDLDEGTHALDTTQDVYDEPGDSGCGQRSVLEVGSLEEQHGVLYLEREGKRELMQVAIVEEIPRVRYADGESTWTIVEKPLLTNQAFVQIDTSRFAQSYTQPSYALGRQIEIVLDFQDHPLRSERCEVAIDVHVSPRDDAAAASEQAWSASCEVEALDRGWFVISLEGDSWMGGPDYDLAEAIREQWSTPDRHTWLINEANPNVLFRPYSGNNYFGDPWFHGIPREDVQP
jgi:hypothetical protein